MKAKRLLSGLLAAGMLFGLTSCGSLRGRTAILRQEMPRSQWEPTLWLLLIPASPSTAAL